MPAQQIAPQPAVSARSLTKTYSGSDQPALAGLSIEVFGGEIFGLLGPNGAGKTTTIAILSTLMPPTRGEVAIAGADTVRDAEKVRRGIGLVPQEVALYERLSAAENLSFFGRLHGLAGRALSQRVAEALALVALEKQADQRVAHFSGGMKRRCNLAAGLLHHPRVLFCDEPTVGIDAQSRHMILERLRHLADHGMTLIYTTHYMEEAQDLCDRIAIMDHGKVIAEGAPPQLLADAPECRNLGELYLKLTGRHLRE